MKSIERHKLKENDLARSVGQGRDLVETRGRDIYTIVAVAVVALLVVGGYSWWRSSREAKANAFRSETHSG